MGQRRRTYLFVGGGSGGHISPGLAIAEALAEEDPKAGTVFVCSSREVDRSMLAEAGVAFEPVPAAPLSWRPRGLVRFARGFTRARRFAMRVLERERVDHVVTLGGFVAPPVVAAAGSRVPVTLVNLDDPPGKANRWIARRSRHVLSAVEVTRPAGFAERITGMPVRRRALAVAPPDECRRHFGLDPERPTVLVTGASQGARSINGLVAALALEESDLFADWQVLHLSGSADAERVSAAWASAGVQAQVRPFVHEMGPAWGAADLAVSRAGASSVAEAWANAVPTLFLPYPHHRDRHQHRNAQPMADLGGAVIEPDAVEPAANLRRAGRTLGALLRDDTRRRAMRERLRACPAPDAARTIARLLSEDPA